ncbi:MAG: hypothetical protein LUE27_07035, partial [Clostridia bacterium]|nr:hypothetical protein [Clostridia bacterium]
WYKNNVKTEYKAVPDEPDTWTIDDEGYWCLNGERFLDSNNEPVSAKGEKGDTPYIGSNGNWWIGDTDTEVPAQGDTGKTYILKPNYETGYWELYEVTLKDTSTADDGESEYEYNLEDGEFMKLADSDYALTAIWDGNVLHLYNVKTPIYDDEGNVTGYTYESYDITLGTQLGSVAFVPTYIDKDIFYPTTDYPYSTIDTYLDETKNYESANEDEGYEAGDFEPQSGLGISTSVDLIYRLNPADAYLENMVPCFINRTVKTRSIDGDNDNLINVIGWERDGEKVTVTTTLNTSNLSSATEEEKAADTGVYDFVALRLYTGTKEDQVVTSDYIVVKGGDDIDVVLVDSTKVAEGTADLPEVTGWYARTKGFGATDSGDVNYDAETSDFIHQFIDQETDTDPNATENADEDNTTEGNTTGEETTSSDHTEGYCQYEYDHFDYTSAYKLNDLPGLYTLAGGNTYIANLGITDITYKYTVPSAYYIDGVNQQQYVSILDSSNENVNEGEYYLDVINDNILAVDTYPVVRIDAYIGDKLVGSAYVVFHITGVELDDATIDLNKLLNNENYFLVHYRQIETDYNTEELAHDYLCGMTYSKLLAEAANDSGMDLETLLDLTDYYEYDPLPTVEIYARTSASTFEEHLYNGTGWQTITDVEEKDEETEDEGDGIVTTAADWSDLLAKLGSAVGTHYKRHDGFVVEMNLTLKALMGTEDFIILGVDDAIKTQHTYYGVEATGTNADGDVETVESAAEYYMRITVKSKNTCIAPNLVIVCRVYVVDDCESLTLNELYKVPDPTKYITDGTLSATDEAVLVKGKLNTDTGYYENVTDVAEHFAGTGNVFEYGDESQNVSGVVFKWYESETGVSPDVTEDIVEGSSEVGLTEAIEGEYVAKHMTYNEILDNGEYCPWNYWIIFANPFRVTNTGDVYLYDKSYPTTAFAGESIYVYDVDRKGNKIDTIFSYEGTDTETEVGTGEYDTDGSEITETVTVTTYSLKLSDYAKETYGIEDKDVKVTYSLDGTLNPWAYLQSNLSGSQSLTFYCSEITAEDGETVSYPTGCYASTDTENNPNGYDAGTMVWSNGGTELQWTYYITVHVKVSIDTIGAVEFDTTVVLNPNSPEGDWKATDSGVSAANVVL